MIKNYFKTAWRSLLHNKGMAVLNIAGLTVGMTAAVLIFLWVANERSFDGYHPGADRIYSMNTTLPGKNWAWEGAAMGLADGVKKEVPDVKAVTRLLADARPVFIVRGEPQVEQKCAFVDVNWFRFFSYSFIEGNAAAFGQDPYSLVLTVSAAKQYFGGRDALGQTMRIDSLNYTVRGIVADAPANSSFQYHAFIPIAALVQNPQWRANGENWGNGDYRTFVQLSPGSRADAVAAKVSAVYQRYAHDDDHSTVIELEALTGIHFDNSHSDSIFEHGNREITTIFGLLGLVILLVACINYVNLTTAKASLRGKEVSIRKIVGAQRRQLFLQFVAESLLVSLFSLAATLLLVRLCLPAFSRLTGKDFTGALGLPAMWMVLGVTLAAAFVLNSIYPALLLSSFKPLNIFRGITVLRVRDGVLRKGLVVLQFCVSILLMTGAVVIYRQLRFVQKTNPGYDREQVLLVQLPIQVDPMTQASDVLHATQALKQELLGHSGIENVSVVSQPIVQIGSSTSGADWEGKDTSVNTKVAQLSADGDLQKTLHLGMAAGRWFLSGDKADESNFILNETAVRELHIRQPVIGARFRMHGVAGKVIGVVKDFHYKSMHEKTGPLVVFNNPGWGHLLLVRAAPQSAAAAVDVVQRVWKGQLPGVPLEYSFMDEQFDNLYRQDAIASTLVFVFALLAVFVSSLGLFGLAAFAAEQRTKEIGIRKILGATTASIGALLSRDFVRLVGIAVVVALPLAWWLMSGWLQNFAYRIGLSWWMFALPAVLALGMSLAITGGQAVRSAWKNPVRALRRE